MTPSRFYIFLSTLITAVFADLFVPVILGRYYPNYNHFTDTISTLGTINSPVQKYECATLISVGSLLLIFSVGQALSFQFIKWHHILYLLGIVLFGVGSILAGIYPEDPVGAEETISGKIHGIASGVGFLFLILNPLWSLWITEFQQLSVINGVIFFLGLVTFVLFLMSDSNTTGVFQYTGLYQRMNLFILYAHLILNFVWQAKSLYATLTTQF